MSSVRTSNLRFVALMTAAGLFSGVLTAGLSQVYLGYLSSPSFGAIIACALAISGIKSEGGAWWLAWRSL